MADAAALDALTTPVAWTGADGRVAGANPAFGRWLGVGARRLPGLPLAALEADGTRLAHWLEAPGEDAIRLRRLAFAFPGQATRFADVALSPRDGGGWWLEAHPVAEFPGEDPSLALPGAVSASLKGLAHELRNPLAGLKGAAQLLARRAAARAAVEGAAADDDSRELTALIQSEVERLADLLDRLLSPAPPRAHAPLNIHAVLEHVAVQAQLRPVGAKGGPLGL